MPREGVDIRHHKGALFPCRGAADPLSQGNADAGGLSLEGPEDQLIPMQQVHPCPAHPLHVLVEHRRRVAKKRQGRPLSLCEGPDLRCQFPIIFHLQISFRLRFVCLR